MTFEPQHHRHSIRLKGYNYSQPGGYFVTLVTFRRECLFGEITNGGMDLNDYGKIVDECWQAIPLHFPNVELGAYVIMPNHVHGIIIIQDVGATQWVAPTPRPTGPWKGSLGAIIGAFKMAVTRRIMDESNGADIWQRGYYEHIIRNDADANRIHLYIDANTANWDNDSENPTVECQIDSLNPLRRKG